MTTAIVTPEEVDVDVCYGDFDGSYTKTIYVVDFFSSISGLPNGELVNTMYIKNEADAKLMVRFWELGLYTTGEYGEVVFTEVFKDEVEDEYV
jgi:hypothetical protein